MDPITSKIALGAAGAAGAEPLYVEDVFSTYLYTGNSSTQTITNGIDLSGEGGMVWIKDRNNAGGGDGRHVLLDTARGVSKALSTNLTSAQATQTDLTSFTSSGFTLNGSTYFGAINYAPTAYASWTFRKAEKFFDVVTYTGNGVQGRVIPHSLGSVPGVIIVKRTDTTRNWVVYHRSLGATKYLALNLTDAEVTSNQQWSNTEPTSSGFTVHDDGSVNINGGTYVAYIFAHDEAVFGENADQSVIKCGSYTGTGSNGNVINLGWEPQWVLIKNASGAFNWALYDNMRGMPDDGSGVAPGLVPNSSNAENSLYPPVIPLATGFRIDGNSSLTNTSPNTFIYIAIRRGPMKTPTDATKVFGIEKLTGSQSSPAFRTGVLTDMGWARRLSNGSYYGAGVGVFDRLRGDQGLATGSTAFEYGDSFVGDNMIGFYSSAISEDIGYSFRRAPGFFDVVAYTGTGVARTVSHNLGVAPELMIVKGRKAVSVWAVYAGDPTQKLFLNFANATAADSTFWNNTSPTSSSFTVGASTPTNSSTGTFIAYLFATCPGVSKVGSYTGSASDINVDCGFTNGARFVLIKRANDTGAWFVWDTARGITSGNDPYLLLNSTAAEVTNTDYLDPYSPGFTVPGTSVSPGVNNPGDTFIYLAIA